MTYADVGVNYDAMDPFKRMAQIAGRETAANIRRLNGGEFQEVEMSRGESAYLIEAMKSYFAHPRSPWERGTNENTNGLIRQFFPKGTDFNKISRYEVKKAQHLLNGRSRKALGFQKPYEVFNQLINQRCCVRS